MYTEYSQSGGVLQGWSLKPTSDNCCFYRHCIDLLTQLVNMTLLFLSYPISNTHTSNEQSFLAHNNNYSFIYIFSHLAVHYLRAGVSAVAIVSVQL